MDSQVRRKVTAFTMVWMIVIVAFALNASAASLLEVIESDDVPAFEKKLATGTDPDLRYQGIPIIVLAAAKNSWGVVRSLLNAGANPNDTIPYTNDNALYYAAREGKLSMVKLLIEKGAEVDLQRRAIIHVDTTMYARTDSGNTALTIAVVKNKKDVALYLLSKGADPNRSVVYEDAQFEVFLGNPYFHKGQFTLNRAPGVINHKSGTALEIAKALKWREWLPAAVDSMKAAGDSLKAEGGSQ